ncbi:PucR family transcriptional regulator [Amycolatopsis jejuensis]|uniref:PucR family transcriptional regulator n=1 Tax=Amycolatopsis jejuensis TaxID=330084 RepID=UPI0005251946|nr:helix-turn-helix domain-containing protein [Amycolatopsis jejuensis]
MTVVDNRPVAAEVSPIPLRQLIAARRGWLMVPAPAAGLDRPLAGVATWDPDRPLATHQLVLVPEPRDFADALAAARAADAAAVVVRELPGEFDAATAGVPVLAVAESVSWGELAALARSLRSAAGFGVRDPAPTAGGLFDLAESAALALDGSVLLTDAGSRVLAFACGRTVDAFTTETILARRAPAALREHLTPTRRTAGWIDVAGSRLVTRILVGNQVVGHVVLSPGADTPPSAPRVLEDVATAAAAWFLGEPAARDEEDAVRAELLRGLLSGAGSAEALTERLGPAPGGWVMIGLGAHESPGLTPEIEGVLARCVRMLNRSAATAVVNSVAYVLMPFSPGDTLADRLRHRVATAVSAPLVACVSRPLPTGGVVRSEGRLLRQAIEVLSSRPTPATADLAGLHAHLVIAELASVAEHHPGLLNGALDVLRHDASPRSVEYLDTLLKWFDAGCDVTRAAAALRVHRNTFRYRLQRIEQLCEVNLDDAVERFTLELQVRLLALGGGWGP